MSFGLTPQLDDLSLKNLVCSNHLVANDVVASTLQTQQLNIASNGLIGQVLTSNGPNKPALWEYSPGSNRLPLILLNEGYQVTLTNEQSGSLIIITPSNNVEFNVYLPLDVTVGTYYTFLYNPINEDTAISFDAGNGNDIVFSAGNYSSFGGSGAYIFADIPQKTQSFQLVCTNTSPNRWFSMYAFDTILD